MRVGVSTGVTKFRKGGSGGGGAAWAPASLSGSTSVDKIMWLDGADNSTFTMSASGVATWADKWGADNNASQATQANMPTRAGSGALVFPGSPVRMTIAQTIQPLTDDFSYFVVLNTTQTSLGVPAYQGPGLFCGEVGGFTNDITISLVQGKLSFTTGSAGGFSGTTAINSGTWHQAALLRTKSTGGLQFFHDGASDGTATADTTSLTNRANGVYIGYQIDNNSYFIGSIAEMIGINRVVNSTERQQIEGYLAWKWDALNGNSNLVTALAAGHAYKSAAP